MLFWVISVGSWRKVNCHIVVKAVCTQTNTQLPCWSQSCVAFHPASSVYSPKGAAQVQSHVSVWLCIPDSCLLARVLNNHLWAYWFGYGFSNFLSFCQLGIGSRWLFFTGAQCNRDISGSITLAVNILCFCVCINIALPMYFFLCSRPDVKALVQCTNSYVLPYPNLFMPCCIFQHCSASSITVSVCTNPAGAARLISWDHFLPSQEFKSNILIQF